MESVAASYLRDGGENVGEPEQYWLQEKYAREEDCLSKYSALYESREKTSEQLGRHGKGNKRYSDRKKREARDDCVDVPTLADLVALREFRYQYVDRHEGSRDDEDEVRYAERSVIHVERSRCAKSVRE